MESMVINTFQREDDSERLAIQTHHEPRPPGDNNAAGTGECQISLL